MQSITIVLPLEVKHSLKKLFLFNMRYMLFRLCIYILNMLKILNMLNMLNKLNMHSMLNMLNILYVLIMLNYSICCLTTDRGGTKSRCNEQILNISLFNLYQRVKVKLSFVKDLPLQKHDLLIMPKICSVLIIRPSEGRPL